MRQLLLLIFVCGLPPEMREKEVEGHTFAIIEDEGFQVDLFDKTLRMARTVEVSKSEKTSL